MLQLGDGDAKLPRSRHQGLLSRGADDEQNLRFERSEKRAITRMTCAPAAELQRHQRLQIEPDAQLGLEPFCDLADLIARRGTQSPITPFSPSGARAQRIEIAQTARRRRPPMLEIDRFLEHLHRSISRQQREQWIDVEVDPVLVHLAAPWMTDDEHRALPCPPG